MDLSSTRTSSQYHCCVFLNNVILNGIENRPMNAFFIQITVRNMTSLHYLSHQTNQWVLHCNLNEDPHFSKNLILSMSNFNNMLCDFSTNINEVAMVLTEAAIPASEHPHIMAKVTSTAMSVARQFGNLEDKTIPLIVDITKSHFEIISDPFQSNFEEYVNNQWAAAADSDGFEEFDDNEEEEYGINDDVTRLSIEEEEHTNSPATEASIPALEKVNSSENGECTICLGGMAVNEVVTRMPCNHKFH
ncbi:unnamed protein product [Cuscuta europaea]|uniref:RING-type domain-containing protein n=1 Tax=Cuscuta europaea TaxID=41803 RepID=A0A9P1ECN4_CUSEU|nr:unnamed protein product [Cuscuta europaea]